jgi:hypothetical protein
MTSEEVNIDSVVGSSAFGAFAVVLYLCCIKEDTQIESATPIMEIKNRPSGSLQVLSDHVWSYEEIAALAR